MPNGTYGGVRGRKTKVGRKLSFSSYSIAEGLCPYYTLRLRLPYLPKANTRLPPSRWGASTWLIYRAFYQAFFVQSSIASGFYA